MTSLLPRRAEQFSDKSILITRAKTSPLFVVIGYGYLQCDGLEGRGSQRLEACVYLIPSNMLLRNLTALAYEERAEIELFSSLTRLGSREREDPWVIGSKVD